MKWFKIFVFVFSILVAGQYSLGQNYFLLREGEETINPIHDGNQHIKDTSTSDSNLNKSGLSSEISEILNGINIYVNASAPEGGDGSISDPFTIINDAVDVAVYGDTIIVLPGAYNETINMKDGVSIIGSGAESTQIIGKGERYIVKGANDATLKGFTILKSSSGQVDAIYCEETSPTITENVITNYGEVLNSGNAIFCYKASPTIINNYISSFHMGVWCGEYSSPVIKNNIIRTFFYGVFMRDKCAGKIINNIILAEQAGIDINLWTHPEIKNNIIIGLDSTITTGIQGDGMSGPSISYNDIWNTNLDYSLITPWIGNISADPFFINMDKGDYRLQESSPCTDAGDPDSLYNDIDGSRNDMGAFGGPNPIDPGVALQLGKSIGITSISGFPDDEVSTFVTLDNPAGLAKADLTILYDERILNALDIKRTQNTQDFALQSDITEPGVIQVSIERDTEIYHRDGNILEITFSISETAQLGDASSLVLDEVSLFDEVFNPLKIRSTTNGVMIVTLCHRDGNYVYVDGNHDGFEDGTCENPYDTIQEGIDNGSWGDTVFVSSGEYTEPIIMKDGIYLRGAGALITTIIGSMIEYAVYFYEVEYGEISGFTIIAPENYYPLISCRSSSPTITRNRIKIPFPAGMSALDCIKNSNPIIEANSFINADIWVYLSSPIIKNNNFSGATDAAITCLESSPIILGNKIISSAIYFKESNATIMNNRFLGRTGISIRTDSNVKIANNIIGVSGDDGNGISIRNSSDVMIINNTINTDNQGLNEEGSSAIVMNNIITGNNTFGVHISNSSTLSYNNIWGNINNYYDCSPGDSDISEDPLFMDESSGDYHLTPGSPCIDAGNPDPQYNDLDGSRNDMGAYGGPDADTTLMGFKGSMLSIPSVEVLPGDTIYLPIKGISLSGIADIDLTLSYGNTILSFLDAKTTILTKGFSVTKTNIGVNLINLSMSSSIGIEAESGDFIELKFAVNEVAEKDSYVRFEKVSIKDEVANERSVLELEDCEIKVKVVGIEDRNNRTDEIPISYHLFQNYPNPFNPITVIMFSIPQSNIVSLNVYDVLGRKVETVLSQYMPAGNYKVQWNAYNIPSGVYFIKMQSGNFIQVRKGVVVK